MKTITIHLRRTAQIGRAGGMIWLITISFFFALLDLFFAKLSALLAFSLGTLILLITVVLLTWSINMLFLAKKLPDEKSDEGTKRNRYIKKWFLIIFILEIAGLNIATVTLLKLHFFQYIVPVDILIVALHFLPLGRIFVMPSYYFLGIVVSLITILTMFFIPVSLQIGNLIAIIAIPSLSFIFLNWIIIVYILRDGMKYLKKT
ncbi:MAG: hypothetical protein NTY96_01460 [Bacteroidetes bacterium]|nr:hypothetical protein [Bacteroidota bacterium]